MSRSVRTPTSLETPGTFSVGCNYWASHAGTHMWSDWNADVVRKDLSTLAAHGVTILRVFPLWSDFQPITQLHGFAASPVEIRFHEEPLPPANPGHSGVSAVMLERFSQLCAIAAEYKISLVVGLVTGWMSGRFFAPPALIALDPITNPVSIMWQVKLVRTIVAHAAATPDAHTAIMAWDLGNECNCMGRPATPAAAYLWTAAISNAIKAADPTRPVVSGMHSLSSSIGRPDGKPNNWTIEDQAELTDILTTHPYPYWTRHTRADRVDSPRTTLHATAETRYYADIGNTTCLAEELGTMGPMVASDAASADFARVNLFSLYANDCRAFLWWCAHDQTLLPHAPYDWNGVETELGLLRNDHTPKPVLNEIAAFNTLLNSLPFKSLPRRRRDAVCVLSHNQDDWAVAFGTYVLAKQAHLELDFSHIEQALPDSDIYLLPCLSGANAVPRRKWLELIDRVKGGATLYISLDDGIVPHFNEIAGVEVLARATGTSPLQIKLNATNDVLPVFAKEPITVANRTATILATDANNTPAFWRHPLGQGQVLVFAAPLESHLTKTPGAFDDNAPPFHKVYAEITNAPSYTRLAKTNHPRIALTEHPHTNGQTTLIAINHASHPLAEHLTLSKPSKLSAVHHGIATQPSPKELLLTLPPFSACVLTLTPEP